MISNNRVSGIDIIGDIPWGMHFCSFYKIKEDLMNVLIPYFKAGLENNEFCIWVTSQAMVAEEAKEALRSAIPDFNHYMEKGQIKIIPYNDWHLEKGIFSPEKALNGWIEKLNQALADGYDGLRAAEDTCWLKKESWDDFVDYEEKLDSLVSKRQIIVLCIYCHGVYDLREIIDVVSNHQTSLVKRKGKWERIQHFVRKDTAEARLAEGTLRENEKHYRMLFSNMTEAFFLAEILCDKDGQPYDYIFLDVNPAYELTTGVKREQLIGKSLLEVFPTTARMEMEKYGEVALSGKPERYEAFS